MVTQKQLRAAEHAFDTAELALGVFKTKGIHAYRLSRKYYLWDGQGAVDLDETKDLKKYLVDKGYMSETQMRQCYVMDIVVRTLKVWARVVDSRTIESSPRSSRFAERYLSNLKGEKNDSD